MKTFSESTINAAETFGLISKYRAMILTVTTLGMALFLTASFVMPKKYKSHFSLSIYAKYFQNPLIRDFIPELSDPGEMKAQRQSLIRQALTPVFLDSLVIQYGIDQPKTNSPEGLPTRLRNAVVPIQIWLKRAGWATPEKRVYSLDDAREELLKRIQIFDLNNTTFDVSFTYSDPEITFRVTQDIYAQVVRTFLEAHMKNLVNVRDAIRKRLESLSSNLNDTPKPRPSFRSQIVKEELSDVRRQLNTLTSQFTEEHPMMKELRSREIALSRWQAAPPDKSALSSSSLDQSLVSSESQTAVKDIYNDLMKKMNYLDIALEADRSHEGDYIATFERPLYPDRPLWPKKGLMALWGLGLGFVGSLSIAALREYFSRTTLRTRTLADQLGLPLLGELPVVAWNAPLPEEDRG